jgi:hypothetical protein
VDKVHPPVSSVLQPIEDVSVKNENRQNPLTVGQRAIESVVVVEP